MKNVKKIKKIRFDLTFFNKGERTAYFSLMREGWC